MSVTPAEYLILTEATLPCLLLRALRGVPTCVIDTHSLIQGSPGWLVRVVAALRRRGLVTELRQDFPELAPYVDAGDFQRLTNTFAEMEEWMERRFDFAGSDRRFDRHGLAFRHIVCNRSYRRYELAALLRAVAARPGVVIHGIDAWDQAVQLERYGTPLPCQTVVAPRLDVLFNVAILLQVLAFLVVWLAPRLRRAPPPPEEILLASDYLGGERDTLLWREVTDDPAQVVAVFRDADARRTYGHLVGEWRSCLPGEGFLGLAEGLSALAECGLDALRLFVHGARLPADLFRPLAALPWKRLMYRALLRRFRPKFYWGRDDYNVDHVMRTQELRRVGGTSVGIMHGLPSIVPFAHQMRQMDFDLYYTHGAGPYLEYYRAKWPAYCRVRPIGSVGLDRQELARLADPCPNDVVVILGPSFHQDKIMAAVSDLARALPDRTIWISTKAGYRHRGQFGHLFTALLAEGLPNLREFTGRTYDLFFQCRTWISESSTLIAEAVQFGRFALCLDPDPRFKFLYYRRFPGICVPDGATAAKRIRAWEDGTLPFPRDTLAPAINLTGRVAWDDIRRDFGLPPQGPEIMEHLAFVSAGAPE